jgi:tripartite ATP-independent transporter DctM subunit
MLGSVLIPGMREKKYSKSMCVGPILGGGGLALIIPPTFLGVILAGLADISVADLLVALVLPGFMLAGLFILYVVVISKMHPEKAPPYASTHVKARDRIRSLKHVIPFGMVIFLVMGVIFVGVATPTEAAALGALGSFALAALYRKLNLKVFKNILLETGSITSVIFMIIIGSVAFSQLLAYTGASRELVATAMKLPLSPMAIFILIQISLFILGFFMDQGSIMMISIPLIAPVVSAMGFNMVWFGTVTLMNLSIAGITPPFGLNLFAMKGVVPEDIGMDSVIRAAVPYVGIGILGVALVIVLPSAALWLPRLIK